MRPTCKQALPECYILLRRSSDSPGSFNETARPRRSKKSFELYGPAVGDQKTHYSDKLQPKTEAWYRYYLNLHRSMKQRGPKNPLFTLLRPELEAQQVPESLRNDELAAFTLFDRGEMDTDTVIKCICACLVSASRQTHLRGRSNRQQLIPRDLGMKAMSWVSRLPAPQRVKVWTDARFTQAVGFCLLAQEDTECLSDWWSRIVHEGSLFPGVCSSGEEETRATVACKSRMLLSVTSSQVFLGSNPRWLDEPVQTAFNAAMKSKKQPASCRVSVRSAIIHLLKLSSEAPTVGIKARSQLRRLLGMVVDGWEREWQLGRLELYHSEPPNPDALVRLLKSDASSACVSPLFEFIFDPSRYHSAMRVFMDLLRTAQLCEKSDRHADARWILDYAHDHMPELFSGRSASDSLKKRMLPGAVDDSAIFRRKAYPGDLRRGLSTDEHGNITSSQATQAAYLEFQRKRNERWVMTHSRA